jgi:pimeloyl-ACP methyl ester carboxylesterase
MSRKPVLFIPGFPASELRQVSTGRTIFPPSIPDLLSPQHRQEIVDLLVGPDNPPGNIVAGEPIRDLLGIAKQAQSLYDILRNLYGYTTSSGDNFRPLGWDWRHAVDSPEILDRAEQLLAELQAKNGGAKVVVIVHSTGSLVLRRLLETRPAAVAKIEQVMSFGGTWAGNVFAMDAVVSGFSVGIPPASLSAADVSKVLRHAQAAYDLFPPDPAKTHLVGRNGKPLKLFVLDTPGGAPAGPLVNLRWVPAGAANAFMRQHATDADARLGARTIDIRIPGGVETPPITNVVGWGFPTQTGCVMSANGDLQILSTKEGDGTSAAASASWLDGPAVRTLFVPVGVYPTNGIPTIHSRLWDAPPLLQVFDEVLLDHPQEPFVCAAADGDEMIDSHSDVTLRIAAMGPAGGALPGSTVQLEGITPHPTSFHGQPRLDVVLPRTAIHPDPQGLFRFQANVSWDRAAGGREHREVVLILKR